MLRNTDQSILVNVLLRLKYLGYFCLPHSLRGGAVLQSLTSASLAVSGAVNLEADTPSSK